MATAVGLFGGTFNPVHNGHLAIAHSFVESPFIDQLWILLTPFPPHKDHRDHAKYEDRLKMLKTAFGGLSNIQISTIENELPKPSYSIQTIRHLKQKHPDKKFYFCMGQDSLSDFHTWKNYKEILNELNLLVAHRPGSSHDDVDDKILSKVHFVDHEPVEVSSSEVRDLIHSGEDLTQLLPSGVIDIIERELLYS